MSEMNDASQKLNASQKLLLAAINLGTKKNAADAAAHAYSEAIGQYNEAFEEYRKQKED